MPRKRKNSEYYANKVQKRWKCENEEKPVIFEENGIHTHDNDPADELSIELNNNLRLDSKSVIDQGPYEIRDNESEYVMIDTASLKSMFSAVVCGVCASSVLDIRLSDPNSGFARKINVICRNCEVIGNDPVISSTYSSQRVKNDQGNNKNPGFYDVNLRLATAFMQIGKNYAGVEQFAMVMNMSTFSESSFVEYVSHISSFMTAKMRNILDEASCIVRNAHIQPSRSIVDGFVNITVSYDGTWLTRGHTSKFGIGCVINVMTGYVIDYEVMAKYCHSCLTARIELGDDSPEFHFWMEGHKSSCEMNHSGSSGSMEMAAAAILWRRSEERGLRYTTVLSDGDAKTFCHLQALQIYGLTIQINKEECVNHVAKRMGTALREVVKKCQNLKISLGGRAHGALKGSTIVKLTNYYKCAIYRSKGNMPGMKRDIMASLYHGVSTDACPQHQFCPTGEKPWCFYQKAVAQNLKPGLHMKNVKTPLNQNVFSHVLPIYQRLSEHELLRRCTQCRTQNANESLHSLIWHRCPKESFVSKKRIKIAVAEAVAEYNKGCTKTCTEMQQAIGLPIGRSTIQIAHHRDNRRLSATKERAATTFQKRRSAKKRGARQQEDQDFVLEGETYKAGGF